MLSYKAYLVRWMAAATKVAPFIYDDVISALKTSATAAALQCSGGPNGRMCGFSWSKGAEWDGTSGVGQQMAALEVVQSNLIKQAKAPLTNSTGGTSQGDPNAGMGSSSTQQPGATKPPTKGDKVGAGILTALVLCVLVGTLTWMNMPEPVGKETGTATGKGKGKGKETETEYRSVRGAERFNDA